jgi:hypothetical protein
VPPAENNLFSRIPFKFVKIKIFFNHFFQLIDTEGFQFFWRNNLDNASAHFAYVWLAFPAWFGIITASYLNDNNRYAYFFCKFAYTWFYRTFFAKKTSIAGRKQTNRAALSDNRKHVNNRTGIRAAF